jgi:hypothetical protein
VAGTDYDVINQSINQDDSYSQSLVLYGMDIFFEVPLFLLIYLLTSAFFCIRSVWTMKLYSVDAFCMVSEIVWGIPMLPWTSRMRTLASGVMEMLKVTTIWVPYKTPFGCKSCGSFSAALIVFKRAEYTL